MTGHLVFSTLHTNNAPSAPVRLLEMGVEPYLVSSTLEAVVAQRLVRRLCRHCRQDVTSRDALPEEYRDQVEEQTIYESRGCPLCRQTGYQGRTAIFEMFTLNDHIRNLILKRADSSKINEEAMRLGMRSLRQSGLGKVISGETSLVEIYRVTREETIDMRGVLQEDYR
jgi:type II secretory ATPase GspE/PulE/Tfp pilus assembly ATPase PilB-like protein